MKFICNDKIIEKEDIIKVILPNEKVIETHLDAIYDTAIVGSYDILALLAIFNRNYILENKEKFPVENSCERESRDFFMDKSVNNSLIMTYILKDQSVYHKFGKELLKSQNLNNIRVSVNGSEFSDLIIKE